MIANARTESLAEANVPQIYLDLYQTGAKHLAILLRGHLDAAEIPEKVRKQVQSVDPTLSVFGAQTLTETVSASLAQTRFSMGIVALFALTALLLAGLGIYGVISYMVNERTHEIGIRLALGAERRSILHMVLCNLLHVAAVDYDLMRSVSGSNIGPDFGKNKHNPSRDVYKTKADVVKLIQQAVADGASLIQQQGGAGLDKVTKYAWGNRIVHNCYTWTLAIEHSAEHYGQLVVYHRANNLVPPDSRR